MMTGPIIVSQKVERVGRMHTLTEGVSHAVHLLDPGELSKVQPEQVQEPSGPVGLDSVRLLVLLLLLQLLPGIRRLLSALDSLL